MRIKNLTLCVAVAASASLFGGEKVEIKGSVSIDLPRPERNFDASNRLNVESGKQTLEGGFAVPPSGESNTALDKKRRELLDRQKNWIFMNPYKQQFDSKTESFLEGEKSGGLGDHRLMKEDEKTLLEQFLAEKSERSDDLLESDRRDSGDNYSAEEDRDNNRPTPVLLFSGKGNNGNTANDRTGRNGPKTFEDTIGFKENVTSRTLFQDRLERTPFSNRLFPDSKAASSLSREELKMKRETRREEFNQIIQPRGSDGLGAGTAFSTPVIESPVGAAVGSGPLSSGPIGGGRSTASSVDFRGSGGANKVNFDGGPALSRSENRSFSFGAKAPAPSSFSPAMNAAPAPVQSSALRPGQFVIPPPQRKF